MENLVNRTALVLGANGGVGSAIATALMHRGWTVKALVRDVASARKRWRNATEAPAWMAGDAMNAADVLAAAQGVSLIVHAVNPPGYSNWAKLVLPMLDNTIAAASAVGARVVLPGTVYNYGPDAFADPSENAPQNPKTRKGAIRVEMERRLRDASTAAPVLILRCGDFFGPGAGGNWFSQAMVKPGKAVQSITYPGKRGLGHQWAYLPDVAETVVQLVERSAELPPFAVFHLEGHWDHDGTRMVEAIRHAAGDRDIPVRAFPWWLLPLAAPFVTFMREMIEMRYLWKTPIHMRNRKLVAFLGAEPHTPWDDAVAATLAGIGSLKE